MAQGNQKHSSWVERHGGVAGLGLGYRLCGIVGHSGRDLVDVGSMVHGSICGRSLV